MRAFQVTISYVLLFLVVLEIERKLRLASRALTYLEDNRRDASEESFEASPELSRALQRIRSPAVLLLNQYALNITLNYLCNVVSYPDVIQRLLVFSFDGTATHAIESAFPNVTVIHWPIEPFQRTFKAGEPSYQFFQLFRASLSAFLSTRTDGFWMIQSDTLWRRNLFHVVDTKTLLSNGENLLFDQEGESGLLAKMIAGGCYYAAPGLKSQKFFRNLSASLRRYFLTDNNVMGQMCITEFEGNKCAFIPYRTMTNWRWQSSDRSFVGDFLQYDGGSSSEGKLKKLQRIGADFVDPDSLGASKVARCDPWKSTHPEEAISEEILRQKDQISKNRLNVSINFFHSISEFLFFHFPILGKFLISKVFPYYAYYLVV
ncbi:hypothetical protein QR680_018061 [Steinernema hermaphroditum]|uniref:Nucleotide-diphospho-sugar transferase domain-containing protein n=1 Tax=Steinernema hermaphroditum TaxID=289476 RepID=A0AA39HJ52_9BILA|nr:hypothetical protein QR680_018061 [Steinernema hermaphroditum]